MYLDLSTDCLKIYENDHDHPYDYFHLMGCSRWVPMITLGTPDNPVNRLVLTTTGSVNLSPDPHPPELNPADVATIVNHFTGVAPGYKDAWLRIYVALPDFWPTVYSPKLQKFHVEEAAPVVSLDGVQKGPDNHYGGWVIWNFGVDALEESQDRKDNPIERIAIWAHIGVKGSLFQVVRVGYSLTLAGRVVPK